jgi:hypothetical protein
MMAARVPQKQYTKYFAMVFSFEMFFFEKIEVFFINNGFLCVFNPSCLLFLLSCSITRV